jgi:hypothetical protein
MGSGQECVDGLRDIGGNSPSRPRAMIGLLGMLAALIGVVFLFVPLSADVGFRFGNAFSNGDDVSILDEDAVEAACSAARVDRWQYILPLIVLGGTASIGAATIDNAPTGRRDDVDEDQGDNQTA